MRVEIFEYLRSKGLQLAVLVLLPFLAGAVAFYLLAAQPPRYRGEVEVTIPSQLASGTGAIGLYIANFRQAVIAQDATEQIAAETGVEADAVEPALEVAQVGQANRMAVAFTDTDGDRAAAVAAAAAREGLGTVSGGRVDYEERKLAVLEERYLAARAAVDGFRAETGLLFPEDEYRTAAEDVRELERELVEAEAAGLRVTVGVVRGRLDEALQRQAAVAEQWVRFQPLAETLENASTARQEANETLLDAQTQLALVTDPDLLGEAESNEVPRAQSLVTGVALAAGVAFLLALGLLSLPDLMRRPTAPAPRARRVTAEDEDWLGVYFEDEALAEVGARRRRQGS